MATPDLVSVIIPTFNYARFLPSCIESVLSQTGVLTEVIVVNDGSQDTTPEVLRSFGNKIKVIHQENRGLSSARNSGMEQASGSHLLFLDSDDLLAADSIALRIHAMKACPGCQIVVCKNLTFSKQTRSGRVIPNGLWPMYRNKLKLHLCHFNIAPPHAFLVTRELIERVGRFDETLLACEDYDYWLRSVDFGFVPQFVLGKVYYRKHSASMSANRLRQFEHDALIHLRLLDRVLERWEPGVLPSTETVLAYLSGIMRTMIRLARFKPLGKELIELTDIQVQLLSQFPQVCEREIFRSLSAEGKYYFLLYQRLLGELEPLVALSTRLGNGLKDKKNRLSPMRASLASLLDCLDSRTDPGLRWRITKHLFGFASNRDSH